MYTDRQSAAGRAAGRGVRRQEVFRRVRDAIRGQVLDFLRQTDGPAWEAAAREIEAEASSVNLIVPAGDRD